MFHIIKDGKLEIAANTQLETVRSLFKINHVKLWFIKMPTSYNKIILISFQFRLRKTLPEFRNRNFRHSTKKLKKTKYLQNYHEVRMEPTCLILFISSQQTKLVSLFLPAINTCKGNVKKEKLQ